MRLEEFDYGNYAANKIGNAVGKKGNSLLAKLGSNRGAAKVDLRNVTDGLMKQWYQWITAKKHGDPQIEGNADDMRQFIRDYYGDEGLSKVEPIIQRVAPNSTPRVEPSFTPTAAPVANATQAAPEVAAPVANATQAAAPEVAAPSEDTGSETPAPTPEVPDFLKKQTNAPGEYERFGTTIPPNPKLAEVPAFLKKQTNAPGEYERYGTTIPPKPQPRRPRPDVPPPPTKPTRPRPDVPPVPARSRPDVPPVDGKYNFGSFPESVQLREYALKTSQVDQILRQLASVEVTKNMTPPNVNDFLTHPKGYNSQNQRGGAQNTYQGQKPSSQSQNQQQDQNQSYQQDNEEPTAASAYKPTKYTDKPANRMKISKDNFEAAFKAGRFAQANPVEVKAVLNFIAKRNSVSLSDLLSTRISEKTFYIILSALGK